MSRSDATVYIVDDDASVREALAWLLRSRRLLSESFDSAEAFEQALGQAEPAAPACLLLDVRMPGASGLALFDRLVERGVAHAWPLIFLTGHASVATAVRRSSGAPLISARNPFQTMRWWTACSAHCGCRPSAWRNWWCSAPCARACAS